MGKLRLLPSGALITMAVLAGCATALLAADLATSATYPVLPRPVRADESPLHLSATGSGRYGVHPDRAHHEDPTLVGSHAEWNVKGQYYRIRWSSRTSAAVALRALGAEARVCAPPDEEFATLLERVGVPLVPLGPSVRSVVANPKPPTAQDAFRLAPALVAARFDTLAAAAEGCDALLATGLMPAGARDVADKLGIHYVLACFHLLGLPSRHFPPGARPGTPSPRDETDNRVLWEQDAQRVNALYGAALNSHRAGIGLPPVDNVRDYVLTDQPWLAADATLCPSQGMTDLDVVQTGAWIPPDDRPLPEDLEAFLDAGAPPVYVGLGSMAAHAPKDIARVATEASRAHGRRVVLARGWAELTPIDDVDDCFVLSEVNQQALFRRVAAVVHHGGAGTPTTAARASAPQMIVPQIADQPYWAARVAELGIGSAHDGSTPTVDSLSAAFATALTPETRARASAVAATIRTDGATVAAKLLLDATSREKPPVTV